MFAIDVAIEIEEVDLDGSSVSVERRSPTDIEHTAKHTTFQFCFDRIDTITRNQFLCRYLDVGSRITQLTADLVPIDNHSVDEIIVAQQFATIGNASLKQSLTNER